MERFAGSEVAVVLFENDSNDGTRDAIKEWAQREGKGYAVGELLGDFSDLRILVLISKRNKSNSFGEKEFISFSECSKPSAIPRKGRIPLARHAECFCG